MLNPIGPDAVYHLVYVYDPHLSPDGQRLAFVRAWVDRDAMQWRSQILLMPLPGGLVVPFTQGTSDASPKFAPNGRHLAFLRPDNKWRRQIWGMPMHGGEARPLTPRISGSASPSGSGGERAGRR